MCLNGFHATLELAKPVFRQNPCLGLVKVVKVKHVVFARFEVHGPMQSMKVKEKTYELFTFTAI